MKHFLKPGLSLALVLGMVCSAPAVTVNDGSTTSNLVLIANSSDNSVGSAAVSLTSFNCPAACSLQASQSGLSEFFAYRAAWYASDVSPTNGVYTVAADFLPGDESNERQGGVVGWLNVVSSNAVVFHITPTAQFQVAVVSFTADSANKNENVTNLFNLDGTPATEDSSSAWADLGTNYVATNFATFQLEFSLPSPAELAAVSNATAHITAKVFQGESNGIPVQVSRTIELLTDLPVPPSSAHRIGYFASLGSIFDSGTIGELDNLTANNVAATSSEPPTPPTLVVSFSNNQVEVSWPTTYTSYHLEMSSTLLTNSWAALATSNNRYSTAATNAVSFFRLAKP